jgi:predicted HicB family RNase H-like nuclease
MGRPKVYEGRRATAVRLPPELHERLRDAALARQVSANLLVEIAIAEYLDRLPPVEQFISNTR